MTAAKTILEILLGVFMLASLATTASIPTPHIFQRETGAAAILSKVAPTAGQYDSGFENECATVVQAATGLTAAMSQYKIFNTAEISVLLALVAYESGDFKYNVHHFPSANPGQGTRNMQNFEFNLQYAQHIAETNTTLATQLKTITNGATSGFTNDQMNQVLALVTPDEFTWASAAWYYTSQPGCQPQIGNAVQTQGHAGYAAYLACVGTTMTEDRMPAWVAAREAFGLTTD